MKQLYGNYLGLCINNNDPEKRGRVQIFIPHIMPLLFDDWNAVGEDIKLVCVGDNIPDSLPSTVVDKLMKILPWAESASPILGTSAPGSLANGYYDPSPTTLPGDGPVAGLSADLQGLIRNGSSYNVGSVDWSRSKGLCGIGTRGIIGALTNNTYFRQGLSIGGSETAGSLSTGNRYLQDSKLYNNPVPATADYLNDSSQWRVGDVISGTKSGAAGHVQVYTGNGKWVSDHVQSGIYTNYGNLTLHRMNSNGTAAIGPRVTDTSFSLNQGYDRTSSSGTAASWNMFQDINAIETDTSDPLYGSFVRPEVGGTETPVTDTTSSSGYFAKLGTDRQAYFSAELANNPNLIQDLYTRAYREVGSNATDQQMWVETAANRALFSGRSLNSVVNDREYFPSTSFRPVGSAPSSFQSVVTNVFQRGSNFTNLATDNASAEVAARRQEAGVTGSWLGVDGREFYYRSDAEGTRYATTAGLAATNYASTNGISFDPQGNPYLSDNQSPGASYGINNPDPHGPTAVLNLNNMASGVFTYPAAGALLWVFFREGNPLYPVYFAANYGQREWQSAYRYTRSSPPEDVPGYKPSPTPGNPITSTGGVWNIGKAGAIAWGNTTDPTDALNDEKQLMIQGYDGSNMFFNIGYHQILSKFDRRDQVDGDRRESTGGFKDESVQGDKNVLVLGDLFVKVGNISQPAVDAVTRIQQLLNQVMEPLSRSTNNNT